MYLWLSVLVFRAGHRIRCFAKQSCPVRSLNSTTASILGQSATSENATVHCFAFVRALSSLHLEVLNFLLIKAFIVWKDIGRSMHCKIVVPFLATVLGGSLLPVEFIADFESESITALVNFVSKQHNWPIVVKVARVFALFSTGITMAIFNWLCAAFNSSLWKACL
ncbi:unnamed protein product [Rodentolepis nana]|uniref:Uncharacterized protein n=1 Tax=Rodentolepis nana TaxID=102285 RepID=A0A0R3TWE8_RODNA|nr:unnamed protein product [Rodentolepis nana]